jgi:hypothetical protein
MNKAASIGFVLIVGLAGLALAYQGWRTRGPDVDVIASMVRAVALVERGHIPSRGNLTDLNSFRPPGESWLLAPGVILLSDPRLVEIAATGWVYLATLAGVFILGRLVFGVRVATAATLFYAVSSIAINFAAVLQPKAYPFFTVWMLYCAVQWVKRRDARWLAASIVVWSAGFYEHIEMLPFALVYPAIWWRERPPIRLQPMIIGLILALVMWAPYLAFQRERGFIDLRSQLLSRPLDHRGAISNAYCGEDPEPAFLMPMDAKLGDWRQRPAAIAELVMMNFATRVPGGPLILLGLTIGGAVIAFRTGAAGAAGVIALAVIVPGLVLVLLTETGVPRLLGVWPFEILLIAACLDRVVASASSSKAAHAAAIVVVMVIVGLNLQVLQRVRDWPVHGWSGIEPAQVEWADFRSVRCEDER